MRIPRKTKGSGFPLPSVASFRPATNQEVAGANRDQPILAGVLEANIHVAGLCTAMHVDVLTSYRAEKERAGRIAGVIRPQTCE